MSYLDQLFGLQGKVAVIIGGGGYLCSEMARGLSRAGASIVLLDKDEDKLKTVAETIEDSEVWYSPFDVTDPNHHEKICEKVLSKMGSVDILINGAGINAPTSFFDISLDEWHAILDSHVTGTFLACQTFGKVMIEQKSGSIINISSASANPPLSKAFTYSVAKAGVKNLTQNLAREWAPYNVRVNALRPGFFPTEWSMKNFITKEREQAILGHTAMGRYGHPKELVGAVIWLASSTANFVTGAEITVDGGFSAMTI